MAENEEELLMKVKEESENADLKLNIQKLRSWHLLPSLYAKKKKSRNSDRLYLLGLKITADCSCEFKMLAP